MAVGAIPFAADRAWLPRRTVEWMMIFGVEGPARLLSPETYDDAPPALLLPSDLPATASTALRTRRSLKPATNATAYAV